MSSLAVVIAPVPVVLISYTFGTQVKLILILTAVEYSQNPVFSFKKG